MFWRLLFAFLAGAAIFAAGLWFLRAFASGGGASDPEVEAEDVADLEVFFVCRECGTEYQVTKVGRLTVPRHCGEPMEVQRRPKVP